MCHPFRDFVILLLNSITIMQNNKIEILIQKYLKHQLNKDELGELKQWIEEDPAHKNLFVKLLSLHHVNHQLHFLHEFDKEASWEAIRKRCKRNRVIKHFTLYASAAALALIIGVSSFLYFNRSEVPQVIADNHEMTYTNAGNPKATLILSDQSEVPLYQNQQEINGSQVINGEITFPQENKKEASKVIPDKILMQNQIKVPKGSEYSIVLADGTKIRMNADSHLDFPAQFGEVREVTLKGEAYFDVTHDEARPFIVSVGDHKIHVLGTIFNVTAYPDEAICITLVNGKIKVTAPTGEYFLTSGEQYTSSNTSITKVETDTYTSWTNGAMEFDAMPLPELLTKLSRWYDVDLQLASKDLETRKFTGIIFRNKPLNFALDILHRVSDVQFEKKGKTIYVKE